VSNDIAAQLAAVRAEMQTRPEGLVRHVERVLHEALQLATSWDLDPVRTELAVWGHDLFRAFAPADQLRLARETGVHLTPADERSPIVLHGPVAAAVLRDRFAVRDDDVLAAVRDHTLGMDRMPLLARVILLADKFEERKRRRTPAMKAIRRLAHRDLDLALLCWADWKWVDERTNGWDSHPQHWQARLAWVAEHHHDVGLPGRVDEEEFEAAAVGVNPGGGW
jgi:predicted HD superfamily hydrolase involved in NAD metabolism